MTKRLELEQVVCPVSKPDPPIVLNIRENFERGFERVVLKR